MAPIRVGFMGLSANPGAWANRTHLAYLRASPHYEVVALCNSSVASAQAAVETHGLPAGTRTYGTPGDLAADPDVDLVVCSVNVATHYALVKPALEAGKDVFVEWPLASNPAQARELAALAKAKGVRNFVGLQARFEPATLKIKELIAAGRIGRVLSSTVTAAAMNFGGSESVGLAYLSDREVGGNMLTIHFGHFIDVFMKTLGEFASFDSRLAIQRPTADFYDPVTKEVVRPAVPTTTPDNVLMQGRLTSGAVASVHMRGGRPLDGPALRWSIYGDGGEIELTAANSFLQLSPSVSLKVYDAKTDTTEVVDMAPAQKWGELEGSPANVARLYEAIRGAEGAERLVDFEEAVKRHEFLEELWRREDARKD